MAGREGGVLDLGERLHPADALCLFAPESVGVADRARIHLLILGLIDPGTFGPIRGHVVDFLRHLTPSTLAASGDDQPSFIVITIMRRPRWRRQAERIRPSVGGSLARDQIVQWSCRPDRPAAVTRITIAFSDGQKAAWD